MCKVGIRAEVRAMIDAAPFIIVFGSVGVLGSHGSPIFDEIRAHSSVLQLVTFGCHGRHLYIFGIHRPEISDTHIIYLFSLETLGVKVMGWWCMVGMLTIMWVS